MTMLAIEVWALGLTLGLPVENLVSEPPTTLPIIGGAPTVEGEFDGVVAIFAGPGLCTGTVVSPHLVLTAGHCLAHVRDASQITVRFGPEITSSGSPAGAASFGVHPEFCAECGNDIFDYGYVVLDATFSDPEGFILPITDQAEWDALMTVGESITLVGYGEDPTSEGVSHRIGTKRKVDTKISRLSPQGFEFFAGGDLRDSCEGDSGGPAFVRAPDGAWRLAGVTSRGSNPCGNGGFYGVPYPALEWVDEMTAVNLCGSCGSCDCLDVSPPPERGCSVTGEPRRDTWALVALAILGISARTRRRER